ncbi:MAG: hypothetical protein ABI311_11010 [Gemmatimonadaceae bacterium]
MRTVGAVIPLMAGIVLATASLHYPAVPVSPKPVTAPPVNHTLLLTANDYAFSGLPARVSAGWVTVRMINAGKELHMFASMSVPTGMTTAAVLDSLLRGNSTKDITEWGGPNAVAPGDTATVTLFLPPGKYAVGCFVDSQDGKTHFMKGMMGSFEVVASADKGVAPVSDRNVLLSSYAIDVNGAALTKGAHVIAVRNTAKATHDLVILKVLPGHTVDQTIKWLANPVGSPAAVPVGGTTGIHLNETVYVPARFTPGTYMLICMMTTNNKRHFMLGMTKVITVPAS